MEKWAVEELQPADLGKESQRWLDGLEATQQLIPKDKIVVTMGNSEADIFDLFNHECPENSHLLIRGTQNIEK